MTFGMRAALIPGVALCAILTGGCDSPAEVDPHPPPDSFPALLSELDVDAAQSDPFAPQWELWANGAMKERRIWLTEGGQIRIADRGNWEFPDGTRLTKTFSYLTKESPDSPVPVETRAILKVNGGWKTAVYRWREDLSDADLLSGDKRVPARIVLPDGASFEHLIPSLEDCQACHASKPSFVLGFSELQLNGPLPGETVSQLERFEQRGYFDRAIPGDPERIAGPDARTRQVLGYVEANCVHCHNATSIRVSLDLSHRVFLENTVNQPARNGLPLIVPEDPEGSFFFEQLSTGRMPRLGVQRIDEGAKELLREWILEHEFEQ